MPNKFQGKSLTLTEHSPSLFVTVTVSNIVRFQINTKVFFLNIWLFLRKEISALSRKSVLLEAPKVTAPWALNRNITVNQFFTCHALKTWFELLRVKLYRNDPKRNKNQYYFELKRGSSQQRGFELQELTVYMYILFK